MFYAQYKSISYTAVGNDMNDPNDPWLRFTFIWFNFQEQLTILTVFTSETRGT